MRYVRSIQALVVLSTVNAAATALVAFCGGGLARAVVARALSTKRWPEERGPLMLRGLRRGNLLSASLELKIFYMLKKVGLAKANRSYRAVI